MTIPYRCVSVGVLSQPGVTYTVERGRTADTGIWDVYAHSVTCPRRHVDCFRDSAEALAAYPGAQVQRGAP
jgi:hypothetical protein